MVSKNIQLFNEKLKEMDYTNQTISTYIRCILAYYNYTNLIQPDQLSIINYSKYLHDKKLSYSHIKNSVTAILLFSELVFEKKLNNIFLKKFRKIKNHPYILNISEVKKIIDSINNLKHQTIINLIYTCGLKNSECLNLKLWDIDYKKMLIKI